MNSPAQPDVSPFDPPQPDPARPERTIVTGSDRLARHLQERHAREQLAAGKGAWERPDILPVGAFWRRLAANLQAEPHSPLARRRVLSRHAVLGRWEQLLAESFADQPLLQLAAAARTALDAWQLCRDWQLDVNALADDPLDETRLLAGWGRRFEEECAAHACLPDYALPEAVLAALEQFPAMRALLPRTIHLAGFLELAPRERRHWEALEALGVAVEQAADINEEGKVARLACPDAREEIVAAAAWARRHLMQDAGRRIAIVVPDLAGRRAALKHELLDALAPSHMAAFSGSPPPFNFSLGEPLSEQALVADALTLLTLANDHAAFADAARLCRSPYLGDTEEAAARFALEGALRRKAYAEFSLFDWQRLARARHCPRFADMLARYRDNVRQERNDVLPSEWARRFSRWLDEAGWCRARALDSGEFQAREAWHGALGKLAELDAVLGRVPRATALAWLRRLTNETAFQPRAADAPVQVLGLLEATGMQFDAVWVMGLTDDVLPAAPRPNPFLPVAVQRANGLPQSSAERERLFAVEIFAGLRRAAPEVVCSFPLREKDAELGPSPLLHGLPEASPPSAHIPLTHALFDSAVLETVADRQGPGHAGGEIKGGTALLQNQSHCPFRAFAIHRLHADEWPTPQPGPDAKTRGSIAHRALEILWKQWRQRSTLERARANGELEGAVRAAVVEAVDAGRREAPQQWRDSLRDLEIARLTGVLMRWFENVELSRPDFSVREIEARHRLHAGPLILDAKLDRVDGMHDGELIIDYKTGEPPRASHFFGERMAAPQLPAYLVARKQSGAGAAAGIAVASLRTGRERLNGVMQREDGASPLIAGMSDVAKSSPFDDWNDAVAHWEAAIDALGNAFANGEAGVDPLPGACTYCHLATLCRIHEQARANDEESGDE